MTFSTPADMNYTRMYEIMQWVNEVTEYNFGIAILLATFTIAFFSLRPFGNKSALSTSAFITMLISFLLRTLGILNDTYVFICIIGTVLGAIWLMKK